ncbi:hypothetical protein SLS56_009845 [Neofusicoccum ribis]|uniref:ferric-chelate reductase (NADPH) n=1 Tax=Neofusicoccum ribis TaxID=45134 RepID=A0ABR3SHJ5_9PEZI
MCLIHRLAGIATFVNAIFHTCIAFGDVKSQNISTLIAPIAFAALAITSLPPIRKYWYEPFLRVHQLSSIVGAFSLWWHVSTTNTFVFICQTVIAIVFLTALVTHIAMILYRNDVYHGGPAARITGSDELVQIELELKKPLSIQPGQYVNLWIPSLGICSFAQSHPFIVVSWSETPMHSLRLVVEPLNGLTRKMAEAANRSSEPRKALFSGPHGKSFTLQGYSNVVIIATGLGIFAQLPYLQKLAHCSDKRRIHVVWYMGSSNDTPTPGVAYDMAKDTINKALEKNHVC